MRRIALVILIMFSVLQTFAQEMKVLSFVRAETDMTATNNRVLDVNDRVCALIKVETSESGISFTFGTSQIVKREEQNVEHPGEIWLYVPPGVTKVTIQKAGYPVIRDYPLSEMLQSGRTYIMKLTCDKVVSYVETAVSGQFVSFVVSPPDAYLEFDGKPLQLKNGQTSTANPVPFGIYSYKVEAENYHSENGKVDVNDPDNSIVVNVTLKPAYGSLDVSGESVRGGTVYLDKKYIGIAPVVLDVVPSGRHTVKVAKDMYNPYEAEIEISDGKKTIVSPIMQPNFQNITFKVDGNAEIWINGKLRGTGSVKDDFEAGTLFVECKRENHRTTSANYPSVAGALPTTITLASPIPIYGVLLVKSNPIGADVYVDGENKGKTPRQLAQTIIGSHKVKILKEGYLPYEETVTILEGQTKTVEIDLDNMIQVSFSCNAGHIPLLVDGENAGFADESCYLSLGRHQIECTAEGYNSYNETIVVEKDTHSFSIKMESIVVNLSLSKSTINSNASGESFTIRVSTDAPNWDISSKPSWCECSGKTKDSFTLKLLPNNSSSPRCSSVEVEAGNKVVSVIVNQQGKKSNASTQPITTFVGLNLGVGYQSNAAFQSINGSIGIDLLWNKYYDNYYGLFLSYRSIDNISVGPLFMFGNFIIGAGMNLNVGRNIYSGLPVGVQSRRLNMGYDGVLRLGGKFGRVYMFAEGGLGKINGADNFYNEVTQSAESREWSKLNWTTSLGLGVHLNGSGNNKYKPQKSYKVKNERQHNYKGLCRAYYDNVGDWSITWFKPYGFCGLFVYDRGDYESNFGGYFDFFAFRIKMFEISLASFGYDEYCISWGWTPRLRLHIPIWYSGSLFTDFGVHVGIFGEFYTQLGVQWVCSDWGFLETFVRGVSDFGSSDFGLYGSGFAISAGVSFGFYTGW